MKQKMFINPKVILSHTHTLTKSNAKRFEKRLTLDYGVSLSGGEEKVESSI